jgi:hypothetical protein
MNYHCDMYLRIMKYLRGRAELRHYRIAPTGRLCKLLCARVFTPPNQSLNSSTTSLRSWCSPSGVLHASRSQPRDLSHPWSMVSGTVSTTAGAASASRRKRRVRRVVDGMGGMGGMGGCNSGRMQGEQSGGKPGQGYAAQLPPPVTSAAALLFLTKISPKCHNDQQPCAAWQSRPGPRSRRPGLRARPVGARARRPSAQSILAIRSATCSCRGHGGCVRAWLCRWVARAKTSRRLALTSGHLQQACHHRHQRARRRRPLHLWSGWVSQAPTPPLGAVARSTGPLRNAWRRRRSSRTPTPPCPCCALALTRRRLQLLVQPLQTTPCYVGGCALGHKV